MFVHDSMDWHLGLCSVGKDATAHWSMWSSDRTVKKIWSLFLCSLILQEASLGYLIRCVLVFNIKKAAVESYLPATSPFQVSDGSLDQALRECKKTITEAWEWRESWVIECNCCNNPEKAMAPHSSTFAWRIPWTEEPWWAAVHGVARVGHDWATSLSLFTFKHWRRKWQPTPMFLPGESQGWGSL